MLRQSFNEGWSFYKAGREGRRTVMLPMMPCWKKRAHPMHRVAVLGPFSMEMFILMRRNLKRRKIGKGSISSFSSREFTEMPEYF